MSHDDATPTPSRKIDSFWLMTLRDYAIRFRIEHGAEPFVCAHCSCAIPLNDLTNTDYVIWDEHGTPVAHVWCREDATNPDYAPEGGTGT